MVEKIWKICRKIAFSECYQTLEIVFRIIFHCILKRPNFNFLTGIHFPLHSFYTRNLIYIEPKAALIPTIQLRWLFTDPYLKTKTPQFQGTWQNSILKLFLLSSLRLLWVSNLGCIWFDVNRIPSVKWMQGKMNSHKEIKIRTFGCAMENSPKNDF